ncbi:glycoside hydrolase family 108 protein [Azospirillum soli]|uniref:glycoside hydrolase family 108 protein n=1 Tax=Azospirillum soli TaxID=1304799 RepID=UPI001AEB1441|nr:N-acetylmuramidase [Azospirillum soli]MBP2311875.1 lysozyme family protein [Azospirillum soli]
MPDAQRDRIETIIDDILRREGWPKFTNHPADKGGPTKGGITLATLRSWRASQPVVTAADVEALTETEARAIYHHRYVVQPGYAGIADPALRDAVVDCAVLYGADDASPWLQQAAVMLGAKIKVDGKVGPATIAAVNALDAGKLLVLVVAFRIMKAGEIVTKDAKKRGRTEDQALNAWGWCNRAADFLVSWATGREVA